MITLSDIRLNEARVDIREALDDCPRDLVLRSYGKHNRREGSTILAWPSLKRALRRHVQLDGTEPKAIIVFPLRHGNTEMQIRFRTNRVSPRYEGRSTALYAGLRDNGNVKPLVDQGVTAVRVVGKPTIEQLFWYRPKTLRATLTPRATFEPPTIGRGR